MPGTALHVRDGVGVEAWVAPSSLVELLHAARLSTQTIPIAVTADNFTDQWCAIPVQKKPAGAEISLDTR
jgi:hypothetical protein